MRKRSSSYIGQRVLGLLLLSTILSSCGVPATQQAATSPVPSNTAGPSASPIASAPASAAATAEPSETLKPSPTAEPSAAPSQQPSPTAAATAEPSAAAGVLPAPLLFMREGQIVRLERDGKTVTPITHEQPGQPDILAVTDFDVSPVDGSLAYVVQGSGANTLVRTDAQGQQRTVLLENAAVSVPRWSPDGSQIALNIWASPEQTDGQPGGVYLIPATGGELQLLQANDRNDPASPATDARGYMAHRWSPDGKRLLLSAYSLSVETCSAAVKDISSGALVPIQAPEGMVSGCGSGQWSVDGSTIYIGMAHPGPQPPVPGLWQADPETGAITPFIQGKFEVGYQLVTNHRPLEDGSVYAFQASVDKLPEPFNGVMPQYKLFVLGKTDGMALRDEEFPVTGQALWAADNSGVVADLAYPDGNVVTAWIPIDGGAVVQLGPFMGEAKQWGQD